MKRTEKFNMDDFEKLQAWKALKKPVLAADKDCLNCHFRNNLNATKTMMPCDVCHLPPDRGKRKVTYSQWKWDGQ